MRTIAELIELLAAASPIHAQSQGQAAKATGMYRIDLREAADNYTNSLPIERPAP